MVTSCNIPTLPEFGLGKRNPSRGRVLLIAVFFLTLALAIASPSTAQAQSRCDDSVAVPNPSANSGLIADCEALLDAKATLDPGNVLDWNVDTPITDWEGISVSHGRVTGLTANGKGLAGSIPSELGNLTDLTILNLSGNKLGGAIPAELGDLTNLTIFYLHNNELSGPIPAELGNLRDLTRFYLHTNELTGSIPAELGDLTNLTILYLSNNKLTGPVPAELGNLTALTLLYLNGNKLTGPIPAELGNLTNLTILYLSNNKLTGPIPAELGDLTNLTSLNLADNQLTSLIPPGLGNLTASTLLYLNGNELSGPIPTELSNLIKLSVLNLHCNTLTGAVPPELGNAAFLTTLTIDGNHFTEPLPALGGVTVTSTDEICGSAFNASPTFSESGPATRIVVENWNTNHDIGNPVEATDADNDSLIYSLLGNDAASFGIDSSTGQLKKKAALDRATKDSYSVTVRADDSYGGSAIISVTISVIALPSEPIIGTITIGNEELTVPWSAPTRDSGSAIIAYDLRYRPSGGAEWELADDPWTRGTGTPPFRYKIRSLTNGTVYEVQVRAVNGVEEGPWSSTEAGTPVAVAEPAVNPRPPETDKGGAQLSALAVALMVIGGLAIGAIVGGIVVAGVYRRWGWTSFLWGADSPPAVIARGVATAVRWLNSALTSIAHDVATVVRGVVRMVRRNH